MIAPAYSLYDAACPALVSAVDLGRMLGYSADHVRRLSRRDAAFGRCRVVRAGSQPRYSTKAVREWIEAPKPVKQSRLEQVLAEYGASS